ncbi:MAG TPA: DUF3147 family protein [Burkholderiales bacterium]|nr:DUF3147 family protein [Burkholderiales bacterium]
MTEYAIKVLLSAVLIVLVTELAKRSTLAGAVIASLPLTSLLAFVWLYWDTRDASRVAGLSVDIFWLVIPSLALFLVLPYLIRLGWGFWSSLLTAMVATVACYGLTVLALGKFGSG